jgi:hypothetical protein
MKTALKRATVYLEPDLHRALRYKAMETTSSVSALINTAMRWSLREDAADLAAFEQRAQEPNLDFEAVLKDMKRRGKL